MENNFNVKDLFGLEGIMKLFNTTNIKDVVALEKKLINFLTQEQLEEIAKYEKEILNDLVNSKNDYQALQETHKKLVEKLGSIGIDVNTILNPPQENQQVEHNDVENDHFILSYDELGISEEDNIDDIIESHIEEYLNENDYNYDDFVYDIDEDNQEVSITLYH